MQNSFWDWADFQVLLLLVSGTKNELNNQDFEWFLNVFESRIGM